jgi:hypothetical protein
MRAATAALFYEISHPQERPAGFFASIWDPTHLISALFYSIPRLRTSVFA